MYTETVLGGIIVGSTFWADVSAIALLALRQWRWASSALLVNLGLLQVVAVGFALVGGAALVPAVLWTGLVTLIAAATLSPLALAAAWAGSHFVRFVVAEEQQPPSS